MSEQAKHKILDTKERLLFITNAHVEALAADNYMLMRAMASDSC
jgi:hypothetical protein